MSPKLRDLLAPLFSATDGLIRRLTADEAESAFSVKLKEFGSSPIPFGFLNPEWKKLKAKLRTVDELWEYRVTFPRGHTCRGVKLVRNGKVIDWLGAEVRRKRKAAPKTAVKRKSTREK